MLVEFTIAPLGESESVSAQIAPLIEIIEASGLEHQTHAMGTIVEGDWDEVMALIKTCHMKLRETSRRVSTRIAIDDREGAKGRLKGKIKSLESKLGREIRK